jgi:hypothetical protein
VQHAGKLVRDLREDGGKAAMAEIDQSDRKRDSIQKLSGNEVYYTA